MDNWSLFAVLLVPVVHTAPEISVPMALALGIVCWGLCRGTALRMAGSPLPAWLLTAQWLCAAAVAGTLAAWSEAYWPTFEGNRGIVLTVTALAWWISEQGEAVLRRGVRVLVWFLGTTAAVILLSAIWEIQPENLWEEPMLYLKNGDYLLVMLLPLLLPWDSKNGKWLIPLACAADIITVGVLGWDMIGQVPSGFYTLSRSISLFGRISRFESIAAAAMTAGMCAAIAAILGKLPRNRFGAAALATVIGFFGGLHTEYLTIAVVLLWTVFPILLSILGEGKEK